MYMLRRTAYRSNFHRVIFDREVHIARKSKIENKAIMVDEKVESVRSDNKQVRLFYRRLYGENVLSKGLQVYLDESKSIELERKQTMVFSKPYTFITFNKVFQ